MLPGPTKGARLPAQSHSGCLSHASNNLLIPYATWGIQSRCSNRRQRNIKQCGTQSAALRRRGVEWGLTQISDQRSSHHGSTCCESAASASAEYFTEEDGAPSSSAQSAASSDTAETIDTGEVGTTPFHYVNDFICVQAAHGRLTLATYETSNS
jgi:hypothetical protein